MVTRFGFHATHGGDLRVGRADRSAGTLATDDNVRVVRRCGCVEPDDPMIEVFDDHRFEHLRQRGLASTGRQTSDPVQQLGQCHRGHVDVVGHLAVDPLDHHRLQIGRAHV